MRERNGTINDKEEFKIGKTDFIFEHRKSRFQDNYKVDDKILGSGLQYLKS